MSTRIPAEAFPPGEWIRDYLEDRGWAQSDLAEVLGRPIQLVNELIAGKKSITPETAKGLAEAFDTSPQYWLNMDAAYQLYMSRDADPSVALRSRLYSKAPVREMVKRHWLEYSSNPTVLEQRLLEFFGIDQLEDRPAILPVAARMATSYDALSPSQWSWLCRARQLGQSLPVSGKFDPSSRDSLIEELSQLLEHPEETRHLPRVLSDAGIRFIVLEHLAKTKIDGACLWLDKQSPVIVVSLRYDRIDWFWFTVMHELKHALSGDGLTNGELTLDVELVGERSSRDERPEFELEADRFAENALIPQAALEDFVIRKGPLYSETLIRGFASLHKIHPGLLVGQLQHRGEDAGGISYSKFRTLLVKVRDTVIQSALTDGWGHQLPATF